MANQTMFLFLFKAILAIGCAAHSQHSSEILSIQFNSIARGGYSKEITLTRDSIIYNFTEGRGTKPETTRAAMKAEDWNRLMKSLQSVNMMTISELISPTQKRAYDGAHHSSFTFITSAGATVSHSFDDEVPHQSLQPLMDTLLALFARH
jgi:hypothetical protein